MMLSHKRSASLAIRGAVAIIFAIVIVVLPSATLGLLLVVVCYAFIDGIIVAMLASWAFTSGVRRSWWLALEAFAGIGFALAGFAWATHATIGVLYLIAIWAVVTGVLEVVAGFEMHDVALRVPLVISGGLSCLVGIALAAFAHLDRVAVAWLLAVYAFVAGSALIVAALRARRRQDRLHT